jgi:hypothetical protein
MPFLRKICPILDNNSAVAFAEFYNIDVSLKPPEKDYLIWYKRISFLGYDLYQPCLRSLTDENVLFTEMKIISKNSNFYQSLYAPFYNKP